ncbi:MAG: hypothetical protein K0Q53_89 [Massilibacillus sp.]|jgi:uncharacterized membrane protein|nr:hypothetical protein [Massilibacillus sp.]
MKVERGYFAVEILSGLYKVLAVIVLLIGLFAGFTGHGMESFTGLFGGTIGAMSIYAVGQLLTIFIHIEENTRRTANLLDNTEEEPVKKESDYREGFGDNVKSTDETNEKAV